MAQQAKKQNKIISFLKRNAVYIVLVLCVLAALVILCVDEYLWFISLIVFGNGILTYVLAQYFSVMVWGFGDIVGNTKRLSGGTVTPIDQHEETELPEL